MKKQNPKEGIGFDTLEAMRDTALLFRIIVEPACRKNDITKQQFYVLGELFVEPRQTVMDLADRVGIRRTNFAGVCNKMISKSLITRERGTEDKRKAYLDLSPEGRAKFEAIMRDVEKQLDVGSIAMSEEDYVAIRSGVSSLQKLLRASAG